MARGHATGHSMYADSKILKIAQTFHDQASTAMLVPGFMVTCCNAMALLAVPKAQKASTTIRASENRTPESIMNSYFKWANRHRYYEQAYILPD